MMRSDSLNNREVAVTLMRPRITQQKALMSPVSQQQTAACRGSHPPSHARYPFHLTKERKT